MKVKCPFCRVTIQFPEPDLPLDFMCPGCNKAFTLGTIAKKKKEAEELLRTKLYSLYIGSKKPWTSQESVFQAIILVGLGDDKFSFRYEWEIAEYPDTLADIMTVLSDIDYDPKTVPLFSCSSKDKRQSNARLLYLISASYTSIFEEGLGKLLKQTIIIAIQKQLCKEKDLKVVELLFLALNNWHNHPLVQKKALKTCLTVINNHGNDIFCSCGDPCLSHIIKNIPDGFRTIRLLRRKFPEEGYLEALKSLLLDNLNAIT